MTHDSKLPPEVARLRDEALSHFRQWHDNNHDSIRVGFEAALNALAHLSASAAAQGEAVAWHVEWVMPTDKADRARWVKLCANEKDALDYKARYPESAITPLYTHPALPASASAPRAQEEAEGLTTLTVRTRHPADYVLANEQDGTRWRGTDEGRWTAVHEGGEDGEPVARVDCRGVLVPTQHGVKTLSPGQPVYSRTQPAAASAAVREATIARVSVLGERGAGLDIAHEPLKTISTSVDQRGNVSVVVALATAPLMANGMTEAETSATASVAGLTQAAPVAGWTEDAVDAPHGDKDFWTAGIRVGAHGNAIECYGTTESAARALRAAAMANAAAPVDALPERLSLPDDSLPGQFKAAVYAQGWNACLDAAQALVRATPRLEAKPLTEGQLTAVLKAAAEGIDSMNIVMTHWPFVARVVERAVLANNGIGTHPEGDAQ